MNKYDWKKKVVLLGSILLLWICSTGCGQDEGELLSLEQETALEPVQEETPPVQTPVPERIYVDVGGAVVRPGVYALKPQDRVYQAVQAAGGFTPQASVSSINQAKELVDGEQILVPTLEEAQAMVQALPQGQPGDSQGTEAGSTKVNINTADEATLQTLTGIGASKARAILAYREANGPFGSVEEIKNVEGIKEGTFLKIKDDIVVE